MRVYGLTGGIASGKSTVARMLAELGAPVVDADVVARQVVEPGSDALREITERFGPEILTASGELDRKKLGDIVFADGEARAALNAITHPRIAAASQAELTRIASTGAPVAFYEAALIVENGLHRGLAGLVVVSVSEEVQLARLMARDGIDEATARARISAQLPLSDKVAVADYVIDNSGGIQATREQVVALWKKLRREYDDASPE